jgi:hypothetical protein
LRSDKLHRQIFFTGLHTAVIVPHLFEKGYNYRVNPLKGKLIQAHSQHDRFRAAGSVSLQK